MNKLEFISRQLSRTNNKRYESYAIHRLWHKLDNADLKYVTQQYVKRNDRYYLTDLYLPQLNLHIEIDESHHLGRAEQDGLRELDVIEATRHEVARIKVSNDLEEFNYAIDSVVKRIEDKVSKLKEDGEFEAWDLEKEFDPEFYRNKGYLDVSENPAFRRIVDAANCLGQNAVAYQTAFIRSKVYENHHLWFPRLYKTPGWNNSISPDEMYIYEKPEDESNTTSHLERVKMLGTKRIVFPRVKDNLGIVLYRFKGVYEFDADRSDKTNGVVYKRIASEFRI